MSRIWAADPSPQNRPPELALVSDALRRQASAFLTALAAMVVGALVAAIVAGYLPSDPNDPNDLTRPTEVAADSVPEMLQ